MLLLPLWAFVSCSRANLTSTFLPPCRCHFCWPRCVGCHKEQLLFINRWCFCLFFFNTATARSGPEPPSYRAFTITLTHTTVGRTPLDDWSARRRDLYLTTYNTHKRRASLSGIRTRNPIKLSATNPRLRPRGHQDPLMLFVSPTYRLKLYVYTYLLTPWCRVLL